MNNNPSTIKINGQSFTDEEMELLIADKLSSANLPDWEVELYNFLQEWFSNSDTILAKTSGSTGAPTPIELPKAVMAKSALRTIEYFKLQEGNRILLSLPCRFIAGKMMVVRAIVGKMDLVTVDPSSDLEILENQTFDFGAMVPNQAFKLLDTEVGKQKLQNIRSLLIGGAPIPAALESQISQLKSRVVSTYGMTETASHIAIRELSGDKRSDIYHCLKGISVSPCKNDCLQILVPERNEPLQTNDVAEVLSPTSFRILGRADDVIISGGIKYFPQAIEKKLEPMLSERFVISSQPDKTWGERLVLVIEGQPSDIEEIEQKAAQLLSPFERPRSVYFIETFPQTLNGKIKRNDIKQLIQG